MLTVPNIKEATNLDLAQTALNCLEELKHRGNKELEKAISEIHRFYDDIIMLQAMAEELERCLEFEDEHLN